MCQPEGSGRVQETSPLPRVVSASRVGQWCLPTLQPLPSSGGPLSPESPTQAFILSFSSPSFVLLLPQMPLSADILGQLR